MSYYEPPDPPDDEETDGGSDQEAPCGYLPRGGWPDVYAMDRHRDKCDDCFDADAHWQKEEDKDRNLRDDAATNEWLRKS